MWRAIVCLSLLLPAATAEPWKKSLGRFEACAARFKDAQGVGRAGELRRGLDGAWVKDPSQTRSPLSKAYLKQLSMLADSCERLFKAGEKTLPEVFGDDLAMKRDDCFQNGMGRTVPVMVRAVRGGMPESGWEVMYLWETGRKFGAKTLRAPALTPTDLALPPGVYTLHAEKSGQKSSPISVGLAGSGKIQCDIAIE